MKNKFSLVALILGFVFLFYAAFVYYPKWKQAQSEATISWDVAGYYYYLPAVFIYHDLENVGFKAKIQAKYQSIQGEGYQSFPVDNGHQIMKYSMGQAVMYLPAFTVAHLLATPLGFEADGFSLPYQFALSFQGLLVAFLGLWVLRKTLLHFFSDAATAMTLLAIVLATNYFSYASINASMTHSYVFTIYICLIASCLRFYDSPSTWRAAGIGALVGLAALTRPTEIVVVLIPLGIGVVTWADAKNRFTFVKNHFSKYVLAAIICVMIGSLQLMYWKIIGGHWFIYSYGTEVFNWTKPHTYYWALTYNNGWLVYTPIMLFALIGFYQLWHRAKSLFWAFLMYSIVFIYIASAWQTWWYGGSLGQRSVIQLYAILAFPMTAFWESMLQRQIWKWVTSAALVFCMYYNLWMTHQAQLGGLWQAGEMSSAYFWKIFLKYKENLPDDIIKLLDTNEDYSGERKDVQLIYDNHFEIDTSALVSLEKPLEGKQSLILGGTNLVSAVYAAPIKQDAAKWVRVSALYHSLTKEYNIYQMADLLIRFSDNGTVVKQKMIRLNRLMVEGQIRQIKMDVKLPKKPFQQVEVIFLNENNGTKLTKIDNLTIETFNEK
jgi:hypothetical protein